MPVVPSKMSSSGGDSADAPSGSQPTSSAVSHGVSEYLSRVFGGGKLLRLVERVLSFGRGMIFEDVVENVAAVMVMNLEDDVSVVPIGITDRQLSLAFRNALRWYFDTHAIEFEFRETTFRTNGLSRESFLFNLSTRMKLVRFVTGDTALDAAIVVKNGRTLRRVVLGAVLCVALTCAIIVSYYATRFFVEGIFRDDYQHLVKSTACYLQWCIWGVERFVHSHLLQNVVHTVLRVAKMLV